MVLTCGASDIDRKVGRSSTTKQARLSLGQLAKNLVPKADMCEHEVECNPRRGFDSVVPEAGGR